jgi:hypothetical protein
MICTIIITATLATTLLNSMMRAIVHRTYLQQNQAWITLWNRGAAAHWHTPTVTDILAQCWTMDMRANMDTLHAVITTTVAMGFLPSTVEVTITLKPMGEDTTETPDGTLRICAAHTTAMAQVPTRTPS